MTPAPTPARLNELLCIRATQRLTPAETAELDTLLTTFPDQDRDTFELAAAAVHLAVSAPLEEMPAALAEKLHLTAIAVTPAAPARPRARARSRGPEEARERRSGAGWVAWSGWAVAAGLACVAVWAMWLKPPKEVVKIEERVVVQAAPQPTLDDLIRELDKDAATKTFAETKGGATASVVWNNPKQEGVLVVRGLAVNDPSTEQYQLWIVDKSRGEKNPKPISAGLFDVKPDGTARLRVNASLRIGEAAAFAISKEPTGGLVQPTPDKILMLIPPKAG